MVGSADEGTLRRSEAPHAVARLGRRIPLYVKLVVPLIAIAVSVILITGQFLGRQVRSGLLQASREQAVDLAELVRANLDDHASAADVSELLRDLVGSVEKVAAIDVYQLQPDGRLMVWASASPATIGEMETEPQDLRAVRTGAVVQQENDVEGRPHLETTVPVEVMGRPGAIGLYTFVDGLEAAVASRTSAVYRTLGAAGGIATLLGFLMLYLQVLRRTNRLSRAVRRVAAGDMRSRLMEPGAAPGRDALFNVAREFDQMLASVEARSQQQEAVAGIGQMALEGAATQLMLDEAARLLARHLQVEHSAILELLPAGDAFLVRAGVGWRPGVVGEMIVPAGLASQAGYTLIAGGTVVSRDLEHETRFRPPPVVLEHGGKSGITVVIPGADGPFGVLAAHSDRSFRLNESDVVFFRAMANTLGSALEHRRDQERLRQTEEKYRSLVEHVPSITYIAGFGAEGVWEFVSPQVESVLGFRPEEFLEDAALWFRQIHEEDRERVMVEEKRSRLAREPFECEYRIRTRDDRVRWVHDRAVLSGEGDDARLHGVIYDVTERRVAEEAVREARARYQTLIEQVPAVVYVDAVDELSTPLYVSPRLLDLIGYTAEEHLADPTLWIQRLHPEDRDAVLAENYRTNETGELFRIEYRLRHRDGRTVWVHDEARLMHDESGAPAYWQGILYDITEQKTAEDALRRGYEREREAVERLRGLDEMKNAFLAAVSHELRTPLSSVLGYALTLERDEIPLREEERREITHRLAVNARKLERLLADLLDLDRLARGVLQPLLRPADLRQLAERVVTEADAPGHEILLDVPRIHVEIDGPKVERIIENLVANAVKHTPAGTRIWVAAGEQGDGIVLMVEDDGPGVGDDLKAAIFEPFLQGAAEAMPVPGTGIGLSLVARFAELHGGRAWVEDRPGGGASFRVLLPVAVAPATGAPVELEAPLPASDATI